MSDFFLESLTEEERALLAQFEFHAIEQPSDAPVLYIRQGMHDRADASSSSSEDYTACGMAERTSSSPCVRGADAAALLSTTHSDPPQAAGARIGKQDTVEHLGSGNRLAPAAAPAEATEKAPLPAVLLEELSGALAATEESLDDSRVTAPATLHVVDVAPVLLHQRQADGHGDSTTLAAAGVPVVSAAVSGVSTSDEAATPPTTEQRCQDLAERLLQLSAEVDAVAYAMDHNVMSPSDFC